MKKEYNKELKKILDEIFKKYRKIHPGMKIIKQNRFIIDSETSWLSENSSFVERIYCIRNDIFEIPKCSYCKKQVIFYKPNSYYPKFCSCSCANYFQHENVSQEEENKKLIIRLKALKKIRENMSQEEKYILSIKKSESQKKVWKNRTQKELDDLSIKKSETMKEICKNRTFEENNKISIKISNGHKKRSTKEKNKSTEKRIITMNNNGSNGKISKKSQELFLKIYNKLPKELQKEIQFAKHNGEYNIEDYPYSYDFVISTKKICIEYNGEHVHPNPNMTEEKWNNWRQAFSNNKITANEKYLYDQTKLNVLRNKGFKVLEVWEADYKKDQYKVLQECLDFLKDKNNE